MTTAPSYRLKLPCADEREFRDKYLTKYVARGIFVPSENPKPVGTRLKLKLEIRGGTVLVSGDGMVTSVAQPGGPAKPGMTVRLTALHPESIQFSLSPSGVSAPTSQGTSPAVRPPPALTPPAIRRPTPPSAPTVTPAITPSPSRITDHVELFDLGDATAPDDGVMAMTDPALPIPAELAAPEAPAPTPLPAAPAPAALPTPPAPGRRRLVIASAGIAVLLVAIVAGGVIASRGARASRERAARVEEQLRLAELRVLEGRLANAGGDSALDHLLEAKGAASDDPRVTARLKLLADKFDQLGSRALARKNLREAAVHFKAELLADPTRSNARARVDELEARLQAQPASR